jgi:hypothetical protein
VLGILYQDISPELALSSLLLKGPDLSAPISFSLKKVHDDHKSDLRIERYLWTIQSSKQLSLQQAHHFAHAIEALSIIIPFCVEQTVSDLLHVTPLPESAIGEQESGVSADNLARALSDQLWELFGGEDNFRTAYGTYKIESIEAAKRMRPFLTRYTTDPSFARGVSYLHHSMLEFGIDVCDWRDQDYDQSIGRYISTSKAESAFLDAYKVIEAIVGDPGKKNPEAKISSKLIERGFDPKKEGGYQYKRTILEQILLSSGLRDRIAAHGTSTHKRDLQVGEIIELQALARYLLLSKHSAS